MINEKMDIGDIATSLLKSVPQQLFKHHGHINHHINLVAGQYILCRADENMIEFRNKDNGQVRTSLTISGLQCSLEVRGVLFVGT